MTGPADVPFAPLLEPVVAAARDGLARTRAEAGSRITPDAWAGAERALWRRLGETAGPALLDAFRAENPLPLLARLHRDTPDWVPRERYDAFLSAALADGRFLDRWPVLALRLRAMAEDWRAAMADFAAHLAADERALRASHRDWRAGVPPVAGIAFGLSDPHAGRTVGRIDFADGRTLAYKPRSLAAEAGFSRLLRAVSGQDGAPRQRAPQVIDRRTHGWMEWVRHEDLRGAEEAGAFYERCGGLLALLDLLRGGDIHPDNLIAAGAWPMILDLECLFQPGPADLGCQDPLDDPHLFTNGVLPVFTSYDGGATMAAAAAAGAGPGPVREGRRLAHPGSDWMHAASGPVAGFDPNGPRLNGQWLDVRDHADALARGFAATLAAVAARRADLLGPGGALRRFRRARMRLLCAPTNLYALVLEPALSGDGLTDESVFRTRLSRAERRPALIGDRERWRAVLRAEAVAMDRLDVPAFTFAPSGRTARSVEGAPIGRVFATPMYERVERALLALDEGTIRAKAGLLRAALRRPEPRAEPAATQAAPPTTDARDALRRVAGRVEELSVRLGPDSVAWVRFWEQMPAPVAPVGPGLCYGAAGIAVFLAEAARALDEDGPARLAAEALRPVRDRIRNGDASGLAARLGPGYGRGIGGVIAGLAWCGTLLEEPAMIADAVTLAGAAGTALKAEGPLPDLMDGAAGLALGLGALHDVAGNDPAIVGALAASGKAILSASRQAGPSLRDWPDRKGSGLPGLSHGAAGIAAALLRIRAVTGEDALGQAALEAFAYEDTLFDPALGNWHRPGNGRRPDTVLCTWCHGAPGIALARHAALRLLDDAGQDAGAAFRESIATAIATTRRTPIPGSDDLCCGEAGRLEILSVLAAALGDRELEGEIEAALAQRLPGWAAGGGLFMSAGAPGAPEDPSLFRGIAGIGHLLVRRLAPAFAAGVLLPGYGAPAPVSWRRAKAAKKPSRAISAA
ncbi:type 2 lanthipeptide synthetase LanM family protein [Azospirillum sp. SYSU D00513]|uniref:type 2 lanthipeptide synthetase LanM family protein n=1 Tax=Azospirillum sp. SYSU D00513 TaxID=2812561 RepID=UPI001A95EF09|nr:type 2 lanthipeptide synthetase LanM family protein [Azospirillum sp. SYSU D00513]